MTAKTVNGRPPSWIFIVLIGLGLLGIGLFARGFLKVRRLIRDKSESLDPPTTLIFFGRDKDDTWWLPPVVPRRKVILLVIDALRIDFVLPSKATADRSIAWYDKLPILNELARREPENAQLYHFVADPPTATTQRLTGLAAGTLPTFAEVADNFAESSVDADNIVNQFLSSPAHSRFHMYGDDTWLHLFPIINQKSVGEIAGYHSFHLFDLHSVDTAIKERLFPLLERRDGSFDVIVAHFLGVDHCGHKYGPALAPCGEKLAEMNQVIEKVIALMPYDAQLFVLGDHGMTDNGDHGGISHKEVGSVLFSYSPRHPAQDNPREGRDRDEVFWEPFFARLNRHRRQALDLHDDIFFLGTSDVSNLKGSIAQIDFASTVALIAGIPIPFGNVGSIIPEMLIDWNVYSDLSLGEARLRNVRYLVEAIRMNAHQLERFLKKCQGLGESGFGTKDLADSLGKLQRAETLLRSRVHTDQPDDLIEVFFAYYAFLQDTQAHLRHIWADFDMITIVGGLIIGIFCVTLLGGFLVFRGLSFCDAYALILATSHALSLAATSFVTFEDWTVRFMLTSLVIVGCIAAWWRRPVGGAKHFFKALTTVLAIRLGSLSGACREEQYPFCQVWSHKSLAWSLTSSPLPPLVLAGAFVGLLAIYRDVRPALRDLREGALLGSLLGMLLYVWVGLWVHDTASVPTWLQASISIVVPRVLFVACIASFYVFRRDPKLVTLTALCLTGIVQRPVAGWTQLIVGHLLLSHAAPSYFPLTDKQTGVISRATFYYLVGLYLFFGSAHQMTLTNLQWEAAFIGLQSTVQSVAALLMSLNTFSGPIAATIALSQHTHGDLGSALVYLWYAMAQLVAAASFTAVLMRHLQVWKMFTPRFLLQAGLTLTVLCILSFTLTLHRQTARRVLQTKTI